MRIFFDQGPCHSRESFFPACWSKFGEYCEAHRGDLYATILSVWTPDHTCSLDALRGSLCHNFPYAANLHGVFRVTMPYLSVNRHRLLQDTLAISRVLLL